MNAAFMGFDNFLSSEVKAILNIDLGIGILNVVGLDNIFSCKTTTVCNVDPGFHISKCGKDKNNFCDIKVRLELNFFCQLLMAFKEWNEQEFYNLYCNIEEQWFIYNTLNHEKVLPDASTTILATCGGCSFTFLCRGCVLLHPHYRTHSFSLSLFQVEFLVPNLYPNVVSTGLPTLTPNSVPRLQLNYFSGDVMKLCSKTTTCLDPGSFFAVIPTLGSSINYICAPGHVSKS